MGLRESEGAKRFVCCCREREEAVLALERRAWCEGAAPAAAAAAAARKLGGAIVGWRKGASVKGSLDVCVWRVGGMVGEVNGSGSGYVEG